jgi:hypothetical protein
MHNELLAVCPSYEFSLKETREPIFVGGNDQLPLAANTPRQVSEAEHVDVVHRLEWIVQ